MDGPEHGPDGFERDCECRRLCPCAMRCDVVSLLLIVRHVSSEHDFLQFHPLTVAKSLRSPSILNLLPRLSSSTLSLRSFLMPFSLHSLLPPVHQLLLHSSFARILLLSDHPSIVSSSRFILHHVSLAFRVQLTRLLKPTTIDGATTSLRSPHPSTTTATESQ